MEFNCRLKALGYFRQLSYKYIRCFQSHFLNMARSEPKNCETRRQKCDYIKYVLEWTRTRMPESLLNSLINKTKKRTLNLRWFYFEIILSRTTTLQIFSKLPNETAVVISNTPSCGPSESTPSSSLITEYRLHISIKQARYLYFIFDSQNTRSLSFQSDKLSSTQLKKAAIVIT